MNVYWCGAEDVDFNLVGSGIGSSVAAIPDAAFQRGAAFAAVGTTAWPQVNYLSNPTSFGNLSTFWFHSWFIIPSSGAGVTLNAMPFIFTDAAGVGRLIIRTTAATGPLKISTRNAAGTITDLTLVTNLSPMVQNVAGKIDIFVNYSTNGQVTIYWNGVVMTDTGPGVNVTTDSATSLSFFYLGSTLTNAANTYFGEIIVADTDTRAARLWALQSSTAGNVQQWTGAGSNLNKVAINDATYISSNTVGQIEEFKLGLALPAGTWQVAALKLSSRALVGSSGPLHLQYVVRTGASPADYTGGSWAPTGVGTFSSDVQNYMLPNNPATLGPWTTGDLTAVTWNYGIVSAT